MKKQYKQILDIKEFDLRLSELKLSKVDNEIVNLNQELINVKTRYKSSDNLLRDSHLTAHSFLNLTNLRSKIEGKKRIREDFYQDVKYRYSEVEKFKYLYNEEVNKEKILLSKKEQKDLDEIAVLTFNRR